MHKAMYQSVVISCLSTFALALGGCGGGGGGSTAVAPVVRATEIDIDNGISQVATYNAAGVNAPDISTNASTSVTYYKDDGTIKRIEINTPTSTVTWDATSGDFIDNSDVVVVATDAAGTNIGAIINTADPLVDWQYQTFGIWKTGLDTGTGEIGAITVGSPTPGIDIPQIGIVTFKGVSGGIYSDGATDYITAGELTAEVDFSNRSIGLITTATSKLEIGTTGGGVLDPNLEMAGTLNYAANTNAFAGSVTTAGGLAGTSRGQFYGPNAAELGGVFSLTGAGENYAGAYGARKQ